MYLARQGDVLIREVRKIPAGFRPVKTDGRVVLALGEATGHAHAFNDSRVVYFREDGAGAGLIGRAFISVGPGAPAELRHEEHSTVMVPPGTYQVVRQREYSPEAIRNVSD